MTTRRGLCCCARSNTGPMQRCRGRGMCPCSIQVVLRPKVINPCLRERQTYAYEGLKEAAWLWQKAAAERSRRGSAIGSPLAGQLERRCDGAVQLQPLVHGCKPLHWQERWSHTSQAGGPQCTRKNDRIRDLVAPEAVLAEGERYAGWLRMRGCFAWPACSLSPVPSARSPLRPLRPRVQ